MYGPTLDESNIWMAVSSSKMFPSEDESVSRILSSISLSCFLFAALCSINACLSSSRSGLKKAKSMSERLRLYTRNL